MRRASSSSPLYIFMMMILFSAVIHFTGVPLNFQQKQTCHGNITSLFQRPYEPFDSPYQRFRSVVLMNQTID